MLQAACVCADFYEILPKDPKTGSLMLLSATSYSAANPTLKRMAGRRMAASFIFYFHFWSGANVLSCD